MQFVPSITSFRMAEFTESATYKVMETPHGPLFRGFRRMFETVIAGAERSV